LHSSRKLALEVRSTPPSVCEPVSASGWMRSRGSSAGCSPRRFRTQRRPLPS